MTFVETIVISFAQLIEYAIDGTGKVFSLPVPVPVKIIGPDRTGR
jgi:hypothetical protein